MAPAPLVQQIHFGAVPAVHPKGFGGLGAAGGDAGGWSCPQPELPWSCLQPGAGTGLGEGLGPLRGFGAGTVSSGFTLCISFCAFNFVTFLSAVLISLPPERVRPRWGWLQRVPSACLCPCPGTLGCFEELIGVYLQPGACCLAGDMVNKLV